jgi:hypothetical protein
MAHCAPKVAIKAFGDKKVRKRRAHAVGGRCDLLVAGSKDLELHDVEIIVGGGGG